MNDRNGMRSSHFSQPKPKSFKMKRFQDVKPRVAQDSKMATEIKKETARLRKERKEQKEK